MELDNVLNGSADELLDRQAQEAKELRGASPEAEPQDDEGTKPEQPTGDPKAGPAKGEGEPPAPENSHVPLRALEDERRKRQNLEQEIAQLRQQQPKGEQHQLPPEVALQQQIINERLNMSEMMLRQQHEDVDAVIERFQQEAQKNPALCAQLQSQPHPWKWAYDYAKRLMTMDEIGDPESYKQRIREQVLAELQQSDSNPQAAKPNIPQSLAGARSSGARSAPAWSGPTSLEDIIQTK